MGGKGGAAPPSTPQSSGSSGMELEALMMLMQGMQGMSQPEAPVEPQIPDAPEVKMPEKIDWGATESKLRERSSAAYSSGQKNKTGRRDMLHASLVDDGYYTGDEDLTTGVLG